MRESSVRLEVTRLEASSQTYLHAMHVVAKCRGKTNEPTPTDRPAVGRRLLV
jgi:hypothetical protein